VTRLILQLKIVVLDKVKVSRIHSSKVSEEKPLTVTLEFVNETFIGVRLELFDNYPPFFRLRKGSNAALFNIPGKGQTTLRYDIFPTSIGRQEFGPIHMVMRDLAGLFYYQRDLEINNDIVDVAPRTRELVRGSLTASAFSTYAGPVLSRRKGEGTDFADIRQYVHGDPYKRIEWKATARTGELMVRELHAETQLNIMMILQSNDTMAYGQAGETKLDYSARAVASLISYLARRGDFFGLTILQGNSTPRIIPIARGQGQVDTIIKQLASLRPSGSSSQTSLSEAITRMLTRGNVKGRTLFLVISDMEQGEELGSLKKLRMMGHEVIIISPYSPLFESQALKGLDRMIFAIKTSYGWRTRQKLVHEAARLAVPMFDVGPKDLFSSLVLRVEEQRKLGGS
jgi:uncharacterized protein (DUF58 family)